MASALTFLLSCWLAGQSRVSGEGSYPKPSISVSPGGVIPVGGNVTIRCQHHRLGMRFLLYKDEDWNQVNYTDPAGSEAEFPITSARREHGGNYTCRYSNRTGLTAYSKPSDPVQIIVAGGTNPTQPGEAPAPTRPGVTGPEINSMTWPIIAGVSAAAAVLLLPVAFVCFRKTRARKGAAPRLSSTSPMGALKAPAQQDSSYSSIDEGKQPQTPPQEPDPDGLTYAELNHQPLQAKRGGPAPAPQPAQPGVYATINVSRGPLQ